MVNTSSESSKKISSDIEKAAPTEPIQVNTLGLTVESESWESDWDRDWDRDWEYACSHRNQSFADMREQEWLKFNIFAAGFQFECEDNGFNFDYYLIPLEKEGKKPVNGIDWKDRTSGSIDERSVKRRLRSNLGNYGIVACGTLEPSDESISNKEFEKRVTFGFIVLDRDETGEYKLPQEKVAELVRRFETFTVKSDSGDLYLYVGVTLPVLRHVFKRCGSGNPSLIYEGSCVGRLCFSNQYVAGVGSYIPATDQTRIYECQDQISGLYHIESYGHIRVVTKADIDSLPLTPKTDGTPAGDEYAKGKVYAVDLTLANEIDPDTIVNASGLTVEEVRAQVPELGNLLSGPWASATSKLRYKTPIRFVMDEKTAYLLKNNGFSIEQAWVILRKYRRSMRMFRVHYLNRMLSQVYGSGA